MTTVIALMVGTGCTGGGGGSIEAFCKRLSEPPPSDQWEDVDLMVHVSPEADGDHVDALRGHLEDDTRIETYTWVDQQQAYDEFVDHFAATPEMIEAVRPEILPERAMVRVRDADPEVARQVGQQFENRPGVYRVILRQEWDPSVIAMSVRPLAWEDEGDDGWRRMWMTSTMFTAGRSDIDLAAVAPASMREPSQVLDDYWSTDPSSVSMEELEAVAVAARQIENFYDEECG